MTVLELGARGHESIAADLAAAHRTLAFTTHALSNRALCRESRTDEAPRASPDDGAREMATRV